MESFTPIASTIGGVLIGLSATIMLLFFGRVTGISGIVGGLFDRRPGDFGWRALFTAGLLVGGLVFSLLSPEAFADTSTRGLGPVALAGLLVGFGTRLGSGCTSGHGICGLTRLSVRSLVAVLTFMATGALTAVLLGRLGAAA
jgi:uncharacterized membrane protein YedE/YeeE